MTEEGKVQAKIRKALKKAGWLVVKIIQASLNGWPDLQAHRNGVTVFIECKKPGEQPDPLQEYRHHQLTKQGFKVIVAESLKDIEALL